MLKIGIELHKTLDEVSCLSDDEILTWMAYFSIQSEELKKIRGKE